MKKKQSKKKYTNRNKKNLSKNTAFASLEKKSKTDIDEFVKVIKINHKTALKMIENGDISDSKTIIFGWVQTLNLVLSPMEM